MTATKTKAEEAVQVEVVEEATGGPVVRFNQVRLPYHQAFAERFGIDRGGWKVLVDAIWPGAKTVDSVAMALAYCKARNLDPYKKVVHIVPMYSTLANGGKGGMIETVWPGIAEIRTTAFRTGNFAGMDAAEFGPQISTEFKRDKGEPIVLEHPEWCQITVYRELGGRVCKFVGPKVYWLESYASESRYSDAPNEMWRERRVGQLEKCAEAAALRRAFPEELGSVYSAEEMDGRVATGDVAGVPVPPPPATAAPTVAVDIEPPAAKRPVETIKPTEGQPDTSKAGTASPQAAAPAEAKKRREHLPEHSAMLCNAMLTRIKGCADDVSLTKWYNSSKAEIDALTEDDRVTISEAMMDRSEELDKRGEIAANNLNA